jgi:hypothetical protein
MIQRACSHANQNVVFAQFGIRGVFVFQNFRATELVEADCFHDSEILRFAQDFACELPSAEADSRSQTGSTSGPPNWWKRIAFMILRSFASLRIPPAGSRPPRRTHAATRLNFKATKLAEANSVHRGSRMLRKPSMLSHLIE